MNTSNKRGNTPLHLAAQWECPELVQYLIKKGANVDAKNKKGQLPQALAGHPATKKIFQEVKKLA